MEKWTLHAGPITVDARNRDRTSVHGRPIDLTVIEHRLLVALVKRRGRTLSRSHLYQNVWKGDPVDGTRTIDMYISRLRAKLDDAASLIQTVRRVGYRFGESANNYRGRSRRRGDLDRA